MEMLVTKFSKGKYKNELELFEEPISAENVKLMGEMIALQRMRRCLRSCEYLGGTQFEWHNYFDGIHALFGRISAQRSRESNLLRKISPIQFLKKIKNK